MARSAARHSRSPSFLNGVVALLIRSVPGSPDALARGRLVSLSRPAARLVLGGLAPAKGMLVRFALGMPLVRLIGDRVAPAEDLGDGRTLVDLYFDDLLNPSGFKRLIDQLSLPG